MSDLSAIERRKLERAFGMGSGYVLAFSDRTFAEFFDSFEVDIYDTKYDFRSGSKANRMRAFWDHESNYLVGKVLGLLFEEWNEFSSSGAPREPPEECLTIVRRLKECAPVPDIGAVTAISDDQSFERLAQSVRRSIEHNEPDAGIDRLHTFVVKYFRVLGERRGLGAGREKPLHSLVGEYVKALRNEGIIESEMTERILKSTISIMEAFNRVRNEQSFAHDNQVLNYNESLLIFGHVTNLIQFIKAIEATGRPKSLPPSKEYGEIPF